MDAARGVLHLIFLATAAPKKIGAIRLPKGRSIAPRSHFFHGLGRAAAFAFGFFGAAAQALGHFIQTAFG